MHNGETLTEAQSAFVAWLKSNKYEPALWVCPMEEGEYLFAEESYNLVPRFRLDHPEFAGIEDSEIVPDDGLWDNVGLEEDENSQQTSSDG